MLTFISLLGGVVLYEVFGNLSGLESICIAGMFSGAAIGFFSGKHLGMFALFPSFLAGACVSTLLMLIGLLALNSADSLLLALGQMAVGFSLLGGTVVGCKLGDHLFIREDDLAQLKAVFGERTRTKTDFVRRRPPEDS
ncbi:MAG: hypothetical protein ACPG4U_00955 [Pseudomonadales bacterium]